MKKEWLIKVFSDFSFKYYSDESAGFGYVQNPWMATLLQKNVPLPFPTVRTMSR
jgi:hypothetical protein